MMLLAFGEILLLALGVLMVVLILTGTAQVMIARYVSMFIAKQKRDDTIINKLFKK